MPRWLAGANTYVGHRQLVQIYD